MTEEKKIENRVEPLEMVLQMTQIIFTGTIQIGFFSITFQQQLIFGGDLGF